MMDPIKKYHTDNLVEVYVWGATPHIKRALNLHADIWITATGLLNKRVLSHNAALRPIEKLPWPLSKVQAHHVRLTVTFDETANQIMGTSNQKNIDRIFKWGEIDGVIKAFLTGLDPNATVTIRVI